MIMVISGVNTLNNKTSISLKKVTPKYSKCNINIHNCRRNDGRNFDILLPVNFFFCYLLI